MSNNAINSLGARHISLFVPELLSGLRFLKDIPKQEIPNLSALQLILSRAITHNDGFDNYYRATCELTGILVSNKKDIPVSGIAIASEKNISAETNSDFYMFAEPVVMQVDRDSVVLVNSLQTDLCDAESTQLIDEINQHFIDEPWTLNLSKNGAWYLNSEINYSLSTTNISTVLLKNTQPYLPRGDDDKYWRKIINEIEMLMFASEVNVKRLENNKLAVSSLWLWGAGKIPKITKKNINNDVLVGDNKFLQSASQLLDIPYKSLNKNKQLLKNSTIFDKFNNIFMVNIQLSECWQQHDLYEWLNILKILEIELFSPIVNNLRKGKIRSLSLYQNQKETFEINRRQANSWWKPVKTLVSLSSKL
ncbi:hypothetical protein MNBD_GAMMA22-747 [hydrothermal vent metagenome]|uniref:Regulatory protein, RpfE type n=1 Tax=hydrothermal vent metagenome TaxID=652676 RepID=A0A3B0ZW88_9ZZZZ